MALQKLLRFARSSAQTSQRIVLNRSIHFGQRGNRHYATKKSTKLFVVSSFMAIGVWGLKDQGTNKESSLTTREVLIAKADALFDQGKYKELYDLLNKYRDSGDVEILWRISRALYSMCKTANDIKARKMIFDGYDLLCTALDIQEDHWAVHKWMSVLMNSKATYEGLKEMIEALPNVKKHMLRAHELNPKDATTLYMLGNWCFQVSDLAWYQRKIASAIFGQPPASCFEEALTYFEQAEKTDPNFYSHNLLMLGKTYLKLNRKDEALVYLKKAAEYPAKNDDDHKATKEAQKLLSKM